MDILLAEDFEDIRKALRLHSAGPYVFEYSIDVAFAALRRIEAALEARESVVMSHECAGCGSPADAERIRREVAASSAPAAGEEGARDG